jgi:hypothetical protein
LRALLHYLWSEAGFHRWSPAMKDKRNWYVLRKYLLQAAQDKRIRGLSLADALFVPETLMVDKTDAIHSRRIAAMNAGLDAAKFAPSNRMKLLLAEVKEIAPSRFGKKVVVKHLPDQVILLTDELASKMNKRFGAELELWNAMNEFHLIAFGTFRVSKNGIALMDALTLMLTTAEWLPVENQHEIRLVDGLVRAQRRFDKCLRYNLPADRPLASAVLADAEAPLAMYLCPPETPDDWRADLMRLQSESALQSWTWHCGVEEFPALPPRRSANPLR